MFSSQPRMRFYCLLGRVRQEIRGVFITLSIQKSKDTYEHCGAKGRAPPAGSCKSTFSSDQALENPVAALAARSPSDFLSKNIPELSGMWKEWWQLPIHGSCWNSLTSRKETQGKRRRSRSETFLLRRPVFISFPITFRRVCGNIRHIPKF